MLRPISGNYDFLNRLFPEFLAKIPAVEIYALPLTAISQMNTKRPYGWGDYGMIPSRGGQQYISSGLFIKYKFIHLQLQPDLVLAQNKAYQGFSREFRDGIQAARFIFWNFGDYPERFGSAGYSKFSLGQSKLSAQFGAFEAGISTQNLWWGPGQWNALTFSNNAQGFPHLSLNTTKPAKTFLGNFEGQLIMGRIEESGLKPSQHADLNDRFFTDFTGDWKYVNGITVSYSPKWIPGLFLGFSRTFQQYRERMGDGFRDYFPILDPFQKESIFENGNTVEFDGAGRDQTATLFFRWVIPKHHTEFYAEFGRRDHAFNWRDAILTPEHARAYLMGFSKLIPLSKENQYVQLRGEMTHQQESINRYIRYRGLGGGISWHTHTRARGFANYGQPLGVGIGVGSNVQTLELAIVENFNKYGILLERLENQQDFYYRAFGQQKEHKPWVDLSLGFLFDHRWDNLLLSSKVQLIHGRNYQWQLDPSSTPDFPKGENLFSVHSQVSLVYLWGGGK
ncbi:MULTISPECIES: capsule assembly Wzi family protein [Rhodonellum]|uniref:capsule assembly Wzi family protein n=1 Tax=Rhodonellum TaxID=336827 RepID=UPI001F28DB3C|nr:MULTISPECIES: capsule assembly Wzi family protein [Rhodonellum]